VKKAAITMGAIGGTLFSGDMTHDFMGDSNGFHGYIPGSMGIDDRKKRFNNFWVR
jgi:hypothetical protein